MLHSHWLNTYLKCFVIALHFEFIGLLCYGYNITVAFFVLQENGSSEEHVLYVWDHFVSKAAAKNVFIMAHSYGGLSFVELVSVLVFRLSFLPPTDKRHTETHDTLLSAQSLTYMLENLHIPTVTQTKFQVCNATVHTYTHTCTQTH